jgi:hypothetical protein
MGKEFMFGGAMRVTCPCLALLHRRQGGHEFTLKPCSFGKFLNDGWPCFPELRTSLFVLCVSLSKPFGLRLLPQSGGWIRVAFPPSPPHFSVYWEKRRHYPSFCALRRCTENRARGWLVFSDPRKQDTAESVRSGIRRRTGLLAWQLTSKLRDRINRIVGRVLRCHVRVKLDYQQIVRDNKMDRR